MFVAALIQHTATLHRDGVSVELKLDPKQDKPVSASIEGKVIWRGMLKDWRPWKIAVADVDGDGKQDFLIGLHKVTRHRPERIHTIYVYGFDGKNVYPKWRGSRMARDFVDFTVAIDPKGDKILTLDRLLDGRFALSCYTWSGFGFRKRWERGAWKEARIQKSERGTITIATERGPVNISTEGKDENI